MAINHPKAGPNSVPAYQLSAVPYVTGSTGAAETITKKRFDFPYVTRFIAVSNLNGTVTNELRLAFSEEGLDGAQKNYFSVPGSSVVNLDIRCKTVFITTSASSEWSLCAGMTTIPASEFPVLTGSNGFSGVGGSPV